MQVFVYYVCSNTSISKVTTISHTKNEADATKIICKNFHYGTAPRCNAGQYTGIKHTCSILQNMSSVHLLGELR